MSTSTSYRPSQEQDYGPPLSSVGQLLGDISADISTLLRQEVELAKTEARESASKAGKGAGMLSGAALAGHLVLMFLSVAAWWALGDVIGHGWSALVVALVWAVIGAVLVKLGQAQLKAVTGLPQTSGTARRIPKALIGKEEQR